MCVGTVTIRLRSIKSSLPFSLPLCHSRDKLFQALSRFSVLEAMESWAGPGNEAKQELQFCENFCTSNMDNSSRQG